MQTYENSYFHVRLGFPDSWKLISWRHKKIASSWQSAYQTRDDDLPKKGPCASMFLFTAALYSEDGVLVEADIEMSVFRLSSGEDMRKTLIDNFERQRAYYESNGIVTSITKEGVWTVGTMDFDYVDQESKSQFGNCQYRFFFRRFHELFWLYGKIAGHKEQAFKEALNIIEGSKCTADTSNQPRA